MTVQHENAGHQNEHSRKNLEDKFNTEINEKVDELNSLKQSYDGLLHDYNEVNGDKGIAGENLLQQGELIQNMNSRINKLIGDNDRINRLSEYQDGRLKQVLDGNDGLLKTGRKYRALNLKSTFEAKTVKGGSGVSDFRVKRYF